MVSVCGAPAPGVNITAVQQAVVFAVCRYDDIGGCSGLHCCQHYILPLNAATVVGEGDAFVFQGFEVNQLQPFAAFGYGTIWQYVDYGVTVDDLLLQGEIPGRVGDWIEIGHCADGSVSSACCSKASAANCFLPGLPGFPQMNMQVDKGG